MPAFAAFERGVSYTFERLREYFHDTALDLQVRFDSISDASIHAEDEGMKLSEFESMHRDAVFLLTYSAFEDRALALCELVARVEGSGFDRLKRGGPKARGTWPRVCELLKDISGIEVSKTIDDETNRFIVVAAKVRNVLVHNGGRLRRYSESKTRKVPLASGALAEVAALELIDHPAYKEIEGWISANPKFLVHLRSGSLELSTVYVDACFDVFREALVAMTKKAAVASRSA